MTLRTKKLKKIFHEILEGKILKQCTNCLGNLFKIKDDVGMFRCSKRTCRKTYNFLKSTVFYNSKLSLKKQLKILRLWCSNVRTKEIADLLEINRKSVGAFLKKCGLRLTQTFHNNFDKIGGPGITIELDESKFGKNKYHKGHKVKGAWIFGMVERTKERRIVLVPVDFRDKKTLEDILLTYVHKESIVISDCWKAYNELKNNFAQHLTVNHKKNFKDPITGVHTNTIEGNWSGIKQQTPINFRTKEKVQLYLIRFMMRRNYNEPIFNTLLKFLI
jgi:ISXO2-like transposase domain